MKNWRNLTIGAVAALLAFSGGIELGEVAGAGSIAAVQVQYLTPAAAQTSAPRAQSLHFLEFRARLYAPFGHSYAYFGQTDSEGTIIESQTVGLAPKSRVIGYAVGSTVAFVPATIEPSPEDLEMDPLISYRIALRPDQYARLQAFVLEKRAQEHVWNQYLYNCNNFLADLAYAVGDIEVPTLTASLPPAYVAAMSAINP